MTAINVETLDAVLGEAATTIARDLKLNLKKVLLDGTLDAHEGLFTLLAVATSVQSIKLQEFARVELKRLDATEDQIREAEESAAIMGMLNLYYRFRHFVNKDEDYKNAGLRMTSLAKPVLGKERFEMLALAVSVVNGCEKCVSSHEEALRQSGVEPGKIHDLARLAAIVKGIATLH